LKKKRKKDQRNSFVVGQSSDLSNTLSELQDRVARPKKAKVGHKQFKKDK